MIIHSFLTDGFLDWNLLFLRSLKYHCKEKYKVILDSRNLSKEQIERIKKTYSNVKIKNKKINFKELSKRSGLSIQQLKNEKENIEHGKSKVEKKSIIWKQYLAVEQRYRNSIVETIKENMNEDLIAHFDSDTFFRNSPEPIFDIFRKHDISTIFRERFWASNDKKWKVTFGCLMGFKINEKIFTFFDNWIKQIDKFSLVDKPLGYGQTSFYLAYLETKDLYTWGNVPEKWVDKKTENKKAIIWPGCKGSKSKRLNLSNREFKGILNG